MKLTTKFAPDDEVWFIKDSKMVKATVHSIEVFKDAAVSYNLRHGYRECAYELESLVFASKQELAQALMDSADAE